MLPLTVRVFHEGPLVVAVGLEKFMAGQGETAQEALEALGLMLAAQAELDSKRGKEPLADVPPAPAGYWPTPPPVPAPVDVEAVVGERERLAKEAADFVAKIGLDLDYARLKNLQATVRAFVRSAHNAGLAARSAPVDAEREVGIFAGKSEENRQMVRRFRSLRCDCATCPNCALLAQCREALELARGTLEERGPNCESAGCEVQGYCHHVRAALDQVRAALAKVRR